MPGGFEQVDEASLVGARIGNADVANNAAIKPLKVERNPLYVPINLGRCVLSSSNATRSTNGAFPQISFADAGEAYFINTIAGLGEASRGDFIKIHLWWTTSATSGQARFVVNLKPLRKDFLTTASAIQRQALSDVNGTANRLTHVEIEFPPAIFSRDMLIGVKVTRDGANSLDMVGAAVAVNGAYLEMAGRC